MSEGEGDDSITNQEAGGMESGVESSTENFSCELVGVSDLSAWVVSNDRTVEAYLDVRELNECESPTLPRGTIFRNEYFLDSASRNRSTRSSSNS